MLSDLPLNLFDYSRRPIIRLSDPSPHRRLATRLCNDNSFHDLDMLFQMGLITCQVWHASPSKQYSQTRMGFQWFILGRIRKATSIRGSSPRWSHLVNNR